MVQLSGMYHRKRYDGGTIAFVENGDEIVIDIPNGEVNLLVSDEELERRKANWYVRR